MKKTVPILLYFVLLCSKNFAQDWSLRLVSTIEKDGKGLSGAKITLYNASTIVDQIYSSDNGNFEMKIPGNGDYMMTVGYDGCNTKKFHISTLNVPIEKVQKGFTPEVKIEGITMSKPLPGIDYSILNQPLLDLVYLPNKKNFSDDPNYTSQILSSLSNIRLKEAQLLENYAAVLKSGDNAFAKKDCEKAKINYEKAKNLLPSESLPKEKLDLAQKCVDSKAENDKAAAAAKLAAEKAAADKLAAEKAAAEVLSLPMYPELEREQIEYIAKCLKQANQS